MITCPTCGAQNDAANRFCDQCGTRLEAAAPAAPSAPVAATVQCPSCGATVLPGEAFCDNCGADLTALAVAPAPVFSADAPTALAETGTAPLTGASGPATCPVCGSPTIPGERFCDNCGADLQAFPAPTAAANNTTMAAPPVAPDDATMIASAVPIETTPAAPAPAEEAAPAPAAEEAEATPVAPAEEAAPVATTPAPAEEAAPATAAPGEEAAPAAPATPAEEAAPVAATPVPVEETVPVAAPAAPGEETAPAMPAEEAAPVAASSDAGVERKRLEDLVTAHRETVAQYEQMAARYPADSPPVFIATGLDEARRALAQAEADLAAFEAAPAGPDPAEVARLEQLVRAHRETVAQYEQMAARYPAGSVPAFLTAGLEEAQRAQAQAEADLSALLGGAASAAAPAAAAPAAAAAPEAAPTPAPAAPVSPGPRLVTADGQVIALPSDKAEIIVGREDPVSSIFPEVDLTPHGGEQGGVSRQHARITHVGDQWALVDLNSTNYTRVDGVRAEPNVAMPLHDGAKIQFGRVVTTFHV